MLVQGNDDVRNAATALLTALRRSGNTGTAQDALERTAEATSQRNATIVSLGFSAGAPNSSERTADLVATALSDLSQSNVLLAADAALEADREADRGDADDGERRGDDLSIALQNLQGTTDAMVREATRAGGHLGFNAEGAKATPEQSTLAGLRAAVGSTLDGVVQQTSQLASAIVRRAGALPADRILSAVSALGKQLETYSGGLRRLVRIALDKLRSAVNTLMKLLGEERAAALRIWISTQWQRVQSGELLEGPIATLVGAQHTRDLAAELVEREDLADETVGSTTVQIVAVGEQFGVSIERIEAHASTLESIARWGFVVSKVVPPVAPWVTGAAAAGYLALLGAGLLMAMDVADAGIDMGRVLGVRTLVTRLSE